MNSKKVLYLSYDGLTDPLGQSQILPYLIGLSQKGHAISIVSFEKERSFARLENQIQRICQEAHLKWHPLPYNKTPPIISTLRDLMKLESEVRRLHRQNPFDFLHCRSYLTALVALKLKRELGIPYLFDMRGFYADERVDGKIWNLSNPVYQTIYDYFKLKEYDLLEEAAAVISLTQEGKKEMENWYLERESFGGGEYHYNYDRACRAQDKTSIIPCASELSHFDYRKISKNKKLWLSAVHGINPDLDYLGYVGSLGTWYMTKEMLELYKVLLQSNPKLRFLIVSQDSMDDLRAQASKLGITQSYLVHVSAQRREVPTLMSLMSASVFFILPTYSKKASSPTKQGELMAMGVPIICNAGVGDSAQIVKKYQCGAVVDDFSGAAFETVAENWEKIKSIPKEQIRKGAEEYFSLEKGVEAYHNIYQSILQEA
jgi:glycosyltransferase involved in cell wall biosynthesis